jgi:hypothetical protein
MKLDIESYEKGYIRALKDVKKHLNGWFNQLIQDHVDIQHEENIEPIYSKEHHDAHYE